MTSLTKTKIGRWFSISEPRLGLGLGHIQCFYQPSAIASALIDFHWEGKSRATPQKKSFRGVGISVVQRVLDCASEAWREREDDGGGDRGRGRLLLAWVGGTSRITARRRSKCCWRRASEAQLDRQLGQRGTGGSTLGWEYSGDTATPTLGFSIFRT